MLRGKKIIAIGDKDGIAGVSIEACVKSAGAETILVTTECFSCSLAGVIDPDMQREILNLVDKYGKENIVVILGGSEADASVLSAETLIAGDPFYEGPLARLALNLPVYHILEDEIKNQCDTSIFEERCSTFELVLDTEDIISSVKNVRNMYLK